MEFERAAKEALKNYVYALCDPRLERTNIDRIFYIGRGTNDRCFDHTKEEEDAGALRLGQAKLHRIREMRESKAEHTVEIIAHRLTASDAARLESILIKVIGGLTNAVSGQNAGDYWLNPHEINARYQEAQKVDELPGNTLFVSLNGNRNSDPYPKIADDPEELKKRTLGDWNVGPSTAKKVEYIAGVYAGLIRVVFKVDRDENDIPLIEMLERSEKGKHVRHRWQGTLDKAQTEKFRMRKVVDKGKELTKMDPGSGRRFVEKR